MCGGGGWRSGRGAIGACQWSKFPLVKDEIYEVFYDILVHKFHGVLDGGFGNVEVFSILPLNVHVWCL